MPRAVDGARIGAARDRLGIGRSGGAGRRRAGPEDPIVGAAIGVGMTAEAAERGGADFLLVLNAGRYRVMGAASVAGMLPLACANAFTDAFARREILDRVSIPVFFGATAFDPRLDLDRFTEGLAETGYRGLANFPTAIHYDGAFRLALEEAGLGLAREAEMLAAARRAGLTTLGYAKSRAEILQLLEAEVDILCLNFGWNAGGLRGVAEQLTLDEATDRARRMFQQIRQLRPETLCVVEGGPIVSPEDMYQVCRDARGDGYVGGSTLDRVPLELSVTRVTSAFKTVSMLHAAIVERRKETSRTARIAGIVGRSEATRRLLDRVARVSATQLPVLLVGETGTGKTSLARALHGLGPRVGPVVTIDARGGEAVTARLFGEAPQAGRLVRLGALATPGATVILENLEALGRPLQVRLTDWLDGRRAGAGVRAEARLVATADPAIIAAAQTGGFRREILDRLQPGRVDIPALRDRPEDIPIHAAEILEAVAASKSAIRADISPEGFRVLFAHHWPGNMRELRAVLEQAALSVAGPVIGGREIAAILAGAGHASHPPSGPVPGRAPVPEAHDGNEGGDERAWILDGLRRNRFRRAATAAFLGLSRKTLYNKMKRYGLLD